MNTCELMMRVGAFYDGQLPDKERQLMAAHLERCADCQAQLAGLRGLSEQLARAAGPGLSGNFGVRLRAAVGNPGGSGAVADCVCAVVAGGQFVHLYDGVDRAARLIPSGGDAGVDGRGGQSGTRGGHQPGRGDCELDGRQSFVE